jgi:transposase-like protein
MPARYLSHDERVRIVALHNEANVTVTQLARDFDVNRRTVQRLLQKHQATHSVDDLPRSGRPTVSTLRDDRALVRMSSANPQQVSRQLRQRWHHEHGVQASVDTVKRRLRSVGLMGRIAVKKPLLTERHRIARLAWARERQHWTVEEWRNVVFTDESPIHLVATCQRRYVRRRGGTALQRQHIRPTVHSGGGGIQVWGAFSLANGRLPLVRVYGRLNGQAFIELLRENILPADFPGNGLTLQQDNATCHTARVTQQFLNDHHIAVLPWPAQSPDLNPIENVWSHLQHEVDEVRVNGLQGLWATTQRVWNEMPADLLATLVESMPRRLEAVIAARGGSTKY